MTSLSVKEERRIQREQKLIESIKTKLVDFNLVLRQTNKSRVFHIGQMSDYDLKAAAYRTKTGAYIQLSYNPLSEIVDKVTRLLNDLRMKKQIRVWQYKRMMPNRQKVKLGHMYFLPKSHKEGTPLRPIISSIDGPTSGISHLLDDLIRPLFDKHARSTTFINGVELVRHLEEYVSKGRLKPSRFLCTFDITDLYTMLPQEESLDILTKFLIKHGYQKVKGIPLFNIADLTEK